MPPRTIKPTTYAPKTTAPPLTGLVVAAAFGVVCGVEVPSWLVCPLPVVDEVCVAVVAVEA